MKPLGCRFSAPAPLRFRMLSQRHGTFGEETPDPKSRCRPRRSSSRSRFPRRCPAGAVVLVTETFRNTTPTAWQPTDGYTLQSAGPAGNTIWSVSPVALPAAVPPNATVTFTFYITVPATVGTYNFQWQMSKPDGTPFGGVSPATNVRVIAAGPPNYEGLWWNAPAGSESGWGINFAHQGDTIFATWFTYDLTGKGLWLAMTASLTAHRHLYRHAVQTTGPPFNSVPFDPSQVLGIAVGTGTLTFTDLNTGTFAYTINGVTQTKSIIRQVFDQPPTCTFGILSDLTLAYNYQDLWWAAPAGSEKGWGVNLTHQGDTIFATWFTYDLDRTPLWLFVTALKTAPGVYSGHAVSDHRPAVQLGAVRSDQGDGHRRRHRNVYVRRRQYGNVQLYGQRRDADQGDHARGFRHSGNRLPVACRFPCCHCSRAVELPLKETVDGKPLGTSIDGRDVQHHRSARLGVCVRRLRDRPGRHAGPGPEEAEFHRVGTDDRRADRGRPGDRTERGLPGVEDARHLSGADARISWLASTRAAGVRICDRASATRIKPTLQGMTTVAFTYLGDAK